MLQRNRLAEHELMLPPQQTVAYGLDWRKRLLGEPILHSVFTITGGLSLDGNTIFDDAQKTSIYVTNGVVGQYYRLTNYIETAKGSYEETLTLSCHSGGTIPSLSF